MRAGGLALLAGTLTFALILLIANAPPTADGFGAALIAATLCSASAWIVAQRTLEATDTALSAAIDRIDLAGGGDLASPVPDTIDREMPALATAMRGLFAQMEASLDSVHQLALFDPVTGLPNRLHFRRSCERMLNVNGMQGASALLFVDLDRFKSVNDRFGHACGDQLLGMVADRLRGVGDRFRVILNGEGGSPPLIGRLAGDEFTLFVPALGDPAQAQRMGDAILTALTEPFPIQGQDVQIGASIGIAICPDHGTSLTELMRAADTAMYRAKGDGRGRTAHYSEAMAEAAQRRAMLERELREAVEREQFELHFQPQVAAAGGRVIAAEALLRWRHADGLLLPGAFIDCAEETGLIVEIGEQVIDRVANTIVRWARIGAEQRLTVNISPRQIDHASFFRRLRSALMASGAPASLLELELTETLAMTCSDDVIDAITALRADGATIAIDDFGTGYSNLARLRALPIDRIKLDRSLIQDIAERADARAVAQAVIGLVHGLGCTAVAEGIETEAQAEVLRIIGCEALQGYAIAPPMDEVVFMRWVAEQAEVRMPPPALRA
ncbi:putative bifunctional diguanylate cyclase/phosphodiesterase [Sphingomonas sp. CJ99]